MFNNQDRISKFSASEDRANVKEQKNKGNIKIS